MFQKLKVCTAAFLTFGLASHGAAADEALMNGVRPFICDGDAFVFIQEEDGWKFPTYSALKVKRTESGWRIEDTIDGIVTYLREKNDNSWVADRVSEDGHTKFDCIDVTDSVSQVVTIIKPKLDAGIISTQNNLWEAKAAQEKSISTITALTAELARTRDALVLAESNLSVAMDESALEQMLAAARERTTQAERQTEALNQRFAALRAQLESLQANLDYERAQNVALQVQLQSLESEMNAAMARVAAEYRRRRELE